MAPRRRGHTGKPCLALFMLIAMLYFAVPEQHWYLQRLLMFWYITTRFLPRGLPVKGSAKTHFWRCRLPWPRSSMYHIQKLSPDHFQNRSDIIYLNLMRKWFQVYRWSVVYDPPPDWNFLLYPATPSQPFPCFTISRHYKNSTWVFNNIRIIGSNLEAHAPKLKWCLCWITTRSHLFKVINFRRSYKVLGLSFNRITSIDRGSLSGLVQLKKVDLTGNLISQISSGSFLLPGLKTVILNENRIREIFKDAFNPELDIIHLNSNRLSELGNIICIPSLKGLFVSHQSEVIKLQEIPLLKKSHRNWPLLWKRSHDDADGIARILTKMPRLQILSVVGGEMELCNYEKPWLTFEL